MSGFLAPAHFRKEHPAVSIQVDTAPAHTSSLAMIHRSVKTTGLNSSDDPTAKKRKKTWSTLIKRAANELIEGAFWERVG